MDIQGHIQNGLIVPHGDVALPNGTEVTIVVRSAAQSSSGNMNDAERERYLAALAHIDALPNENPGDQFRGTAHDQVLYGARQ